MDTQSEFPRERINKRRAFYINFVEESKEQFSANRIRRRKQKIPGEFVTCGKAILNFKTKNLEQGLCLWLGQSLWLEGSSGAVTPLMELRTIAESKCLEWEV
ncbi:hypothetical protein ACFX2I_036299 [Malus domestica]